MEAILVKYLSYLLDTIVKDVQMYDHWWMWVFLLVPAMFYTAFLILKFTILTLPIWLPFSLVGRIFKKK